MSKCPFFFLFLFFVTAVSKCDISRPPGWAPGWACRSCPCIGEECKPYFGRGVKVEWPELKGVSGLEAKAIIERDNPKVTVMIFPDPTFLPQINCCNRVKVWVPKDNCPNGPVLYPPVVG